jgi:ATP phosphoribosyltransferase
MADLERIGPAFRAAHGRHLLVATKYRSLTRRFFAGHKVTSYRIVESLGATEGAPQAGLAEIVVDITSTGQTLAANHLKILSDGIILRSEAALFRSAGAGSREAVQQISAYILARLRGT